MNAVFPKTFLLLSALPLDYSGHSALGVGYEGKVDIHTRRDWDKKENRWKGEGGKGRRGMRERTTFL